MQHTEAAASEGTDFHVRLNVSPTSGMTGEAAANRDKLVHAYNEIAGGNHGSLVELLDPDIRFHEAASLPYGGSKIGIEATLQGVAGMMASWSHIQVEIEEFTAAGDLVIAYMRFTGTARHTGRIYDGVCAEVFRLRAGLIVEWRPVYWDTHAVREACLEN